MFFYFSLKLYIVTPHLNRLNETVSKPSQQDGSDEGSQRIFFFFLQN